MSNIKFAIGFGPLSDYQSTEELDYFLRKYYNKIAFCYLSSPYNFLLKETKSAYFSSKKENIESFSEEISLIKKYGIPIQLCINYTRPYIMKSLVKKSTKFFMDTFTFPESIVITDKFIPMISSEYPNIPLTYSYNNLFSERDNNNLQKCDTVVLGDKYLRSVNLMKYLKENNNLQIELLVNCGCHLKCDKKCSIPGHCKNMQKSIVNSMGLEWCLAQQSLFPSELNLYPEGLIDLIKLSTRNKMPLSQIASLIEIYDKRCSIHNLQSLGLGEGRNWGYFIGIKYLTDEALKIGCIDMENILRIKSEIWSGILNKPVLLNG